MKLSVSQRRTKPALKRILWTDYPAFFASITPPVIWVVILAWAPDWRGEGPIIPPSTLSFFLAIGGLVTLAGVGVVVWRVRLIRKLFLSGEITPGRITKVHLRGDRGQVRYAYTFHGKSLEVGATIHRNQQTVALKAGERVVLLVDSRQPKRALIRDLYL